MQEKGGEREKKFGLQRTGRGPQCQVKDSYGTGCFTSCGAPIIALDHAVANFSK